MKYSIHISSEIAKVVQQLSPLLKKKVRFALDSIKNDPYQGKPLQDELKGLYSFRVNRYRIVYRVRRQKIQIINIGSRKTIYQSVKQQVKSN